MRHQHFSNVERRDVFSTVHDTESHRATRNDGYASGQIKEVLGVHSIAAFLNNWGQFRAPDTVLSGNNEPPTRQRNMACQNLRFRS